MKMPNELWIYDVIGRGFFEEGVTDVSVRDELKKFKDTEPLLVRINSPGGSVAHAVSIKTQLEQWKGEVNIQIDGLAASAASFIAMAGKQVAIAEGSLFMVHHPMTMVAGNAKEMRKAAELLDKLGLSLQKAYEKRSGKTAAEMTAMMDEETWLTADEAVEHGFADAKTEEKAVAFAIPAEMGFKHPPDLSLVVEPKIRPNNSIAVLQRRVELARAAV
jgi:ATP-dependent Clp protease, protease subunit